MYVYVSSNDSEIYFPNNRASDFTVELPSVITTENLEIALVNIYFDYSQPNHRPEDKYYYILLDCVEPSVLSGKDIQILGSFFQNGPVSPPAYLKFSQKEVKRLNIKVITSDFKVPDNIEHLNLTLHIKEQ